MWGRKIEPRYYLKTFLSSIVVVISALFQWYEKIYYNVQCKKYVLKADPVFIIGHWRTGTTFLHNLMSQDPQMGYVTTYQTVFPNNLMSKFIFRTFMRAQIPEKRPGDNVRLNVSYPQEEEFALTNIHPYNYYQFMYFPAYYKEYYEKYIRFEHVSETKKMGWKQSYQRMVKKAMMNSAGCIPVLKNPCNTGRIRMILEMYPHARFIYILRNPVIVFLSSKKFFTELLPTLWFHKLDESDLEEMIFSTYIKLLNDYQDTKSLVPAENLIEIKFEDYEKDPLDFLRNLYTQFNIPDFKKVEPVLSAYIERMSGYKKNKYVISGDLLDKIIDRWGFSMDLWDYKIPENVLVQ
jgi:hypothetical protein